LERYLVAGAVLLLALPATARAQIAPDPIDGTATQLYAAHVRIADADYRRLVLLPRMHCQLPDPADVGQLSDELTTLEADADDEAQQTSGRSRALALQTATSARTLNITLTSTTGVSLPDDC
jgi:hypothetical protein